MQCLSEHSSELDVNFRNQLTSCCRMWWPQQDCSRVADLHKCEAVTTLWFSEVWLLTLSLISWDKLKTGPGSYLCYDHRATGLFLGTFTWFYFYLFICILFGRQRDVSSASLLPQMPATVSAGLGQSGAKVHWGLPLGWQGSKYLGHHLPPPSVLISRKLDPKQCSQNLNQTQQYGTRASQAVT